MEDTRKDLISLLYDKITFCVTEWLGLEGTFKDHLVQFPCHSQGHLALDHVAQSPIQPSIKQFQ